MSTLKDTALTAAVLTAIRDAVTDQLKTARDNATRGLMDARDSLGVKTVDVSLPDGTKVATITLVEPKPTIAVDDRAFLAWVGNQHPDEVVPAVRDSFRRAVISRLVIAGGDVVNKESGEVMDWARVVPAGDPDAIQLRFASAGAGGREVIAAAWQAGQLNGYAPGPHAVEAGTAVAS